VRSAVFALLALSLACDPSSNRRIRIDGGGSADFGTLTDAGALDAAAADDAGPAVDGFVPGVDQGPPGVDGGPPDMGPPPDLGPDGPTACTPETVGVCDGRPCVDGYCCDGACGGPCESCAVSGLEGTCTVVGGIPCDDGDACTHGEMCSGGGTCGGGTTIDCDGMDTTCRDFSCNGTATCSSAPQNVGGTCDDGNAATSGDMCQSDGSCEGTTGGCALPADACANGSQDRDGCANARIIGRNAARTGFSTTGDTCSARNRIDDCDWDAGNDHTYRIWMRAGEDISAFVNKSNTCFSGYAVTLKLYEGTGCTDVTCGSDLWCHDFVGNGETFSHTATRDGWVVIVVDGSTAFDDEGQYQLNVTLSGCASATCEC
jgi:hypothetical protein